MNLVSFIKDFKSRKGFPILLSSIFEKIVGFFLILVATNFLSKSDFGNISYANSILDFLFPFIGFGIHQSLLRFGAISKSQTQKKKLFSYSFYKGLKFSVIIMVFVILLSPFITKNVEKSMLFLIVLSMQIVGLFGYELIRIYAQLININSLFVRITIVKSCLQLLFVALLTYFFGALGYVIALSIAPVLLVIYFLVKLNLLKRLITFQFDLNEKEFFKYGLFTSFSGVISQLMYATDIILIANILKDELQLAQYKVSNVVPFSFLFISVAFLKTHFTKIANQSVNNKEYVKHYYYNYLKVFILISIMILIFIFVLYQPILLLFGKHYQQDFGLMQIFTIGTVGAVLMRIPLGNIMSAIGWVKFNTFNAMVIAVLNLIFNYYAITNYGIIGAALVTSALLWLSGILSLLAFLVYMRKK